MGILLAIHVFVTVLLIFVVLVQKNEGGSSLFASSGGGNLFSARGTSSVLTKATWTLATVFLVNCVVMAMLASSNLKSTQTLLDHPVGADETAGTIDHRRAMGGGTTNKRVSPQTDQQAPAAATKVTTGTKHDDKSAESRTEESVTHGGNKNVDEREAKAAINKVASAGRKKAANK
ncbi:MAG: preprotein translocase subunit SecG [Holosporales bacterium]|jgi:protein translocase SecG subunit|nr:preprotein translocase subunit SecG [Holosporales bacterium]